MGRLLRPIGSNRAKDMVTEAMLNVKTVLAEGARK